MFQTQDYIRLSVSLKLLKSSDLLRKEHVWSQGRYVFRETAGLDG